MRTLYQIVEHACDTLLAGGAPGAAAHEHLLAALPSSTGNDLVSARRLRILRTAIDQHRESSVEVLTAVAKALVAGFTAEVEELDIPEVWFCINPSKGQFDPATVERIRSACEKAVNDQVVVSRADAESLLAEAAKMAFFSQDTLDPTYCVTCGSCGEEGCCPPDGCVAVRCQYGKTNLLSYKAMLEDNEKFRAALHSIHKRLGGKESDVLDIEDLLKIPERVGDEMRKLQLSSPA